MREKNVFVFCGLALILIGFDCLMAVHYFKNLSGPSLVAVASILLGSFLAGFAAYFSVKKDLVALKMAAFAAKVILIVVGGISASSVICLYFHEKAEAKKTLTDLERTATQTDAEIARIKAHQEAEVARLNVLKQAAADLSKQTGSSRLARTFVEKNAGAGVTAMPTPLPTSQMAMVAASTKAKADSEARSGIQDWLLEYSQSGIYIWPTVANLFVFIGMSFVLMFVPTGEVIGRKPGLRIDPLPKTIQSPSNLDPKA